MSSKRVLPLVLGLLALMPPTLAAAAAQPIEGTWDLAGGKVTVAPDSAGGLVGTVSEQVSFSGCPHRVGEVIWRIRGSAGEYEGTHQWIDSAGTECLAGRPGAATWSVRDDGASFRLHFCTNAPGKDAPTGGAADYCADLTRAKPPAPGPDFATSSGTPASGQVVLASRAAVPCTARRGTKVFSVTTARLLKRRAGSRRVTYKPRIVSLVKRLDAKRFGRRQAKAPFRIVVKLAGLRAGSHVLRVTAKVRLHAGAEPVTRRVALRFVLCA